MSYVNTWLVVVVMWLYTVGSFNSVLVYKNHVKCRRKAYYLNPWHHHKDCKTVSRYNHFIVTMLVAYWVKHWTEDWSVQGSRDLNLSSKYTQPYLKNWVEGFPSHPSEGTLSYQSKEPLKISLSAIGNFLINLVTSKPWKYICSVSLLDRTWL